MNKPKAQGTAFETAFVRQAQDAGLLADRLPEGGSWDCGDVWLLDVPHKDQADIVVIAWSRLVNNGSTRRTADGVRSVVVMSTDDFMQLAKATIHYGEYEYAFVVECKATERLNVTRTLHNAQQKLRRWKER